MINQRYHSLDVFRGATVAFMILVNNPGTWDAVFSPLLHANWHGCTPTDLVFPFFLFAVGNAMAFVMPKLIAAGPAFFWQKISKRALLIYAIGLFLNIWPFVIWHDGHYQFSNWSATADHSSGIRILGVLQRIALAYFFAALLIYYCKPRLLMVLSVLMLIGYWAMCYFLGTGDPYSLIGWFGNPVDKALLGVSHMYQGEGVAFEPEGVMSTLPSVVQVVVGYLVGVFIKERGQVGWIWTKVPTAVDHHYRMLSALMVSGFLLLLFGWGWSLGFPINKKIWTSSYVLYSSGLAVLTLGTTLWFVEMQGLRNGITRFFAVFGKNALFIYIMSSMIPGLLAVIRMPNGGQDPQSSEPLSLLEASYIHVFAHTPGAPEWGSLVSALFLLFVLYIMGYLLDKNKIYIKV